ncbi:unnamed protein product [Cuscuta campestris]|uniref:F-box domain-containing protein n=1 Tax=Cuscuta campestris TaxID=132261 RepID=A0A484MEC9_9ASTE|nr:unnamed protein product [Cuscuta campestris]
MKKVEQYQPFSESPSVIWWEILGRVPIKTCLTCKLVCKQWYHIIVSPEFPSFRSHCNASRFTILFYNGLGGGKRLIFNLVELEKTLDVNDLGNCIVHVDDPICFEPKIDTSGEIWSLKYHCDGGVCFRSGLNEFFVCCLLTGQCVNLNLQNLPELTKKSFIIFRCEVGFCPVTSQFKVLLFLWDAENKIQVTKIQTLGNGEWRSVGSAPLRKRNLVNGCFLNGSNHWCGPTCIWSFNFEKEEFLQIPFPDDIISSTNVKKLSVLDSCLCLGCFSRSRNQSDRVEMEVWIMKEYGVKESWVRQFVILADEWSVPLVQMDT